MTRDGRMRASLPLGVAVATAAYVAYRLWDSEEEPLKEESITSNNPPSFITTEEAMVTMTIDDSSSSREEWMDDFLCVSATFDDNVPPCDQMTTEVNVL